MQSAVAQIERECLFNVITKYFFCKCSSML